MSKDKRERRRGTEEVPILARRNLFTSLERERVTRGKKGAMRRGEREGERSFPPPLPPHVHLRARGIGRASLLATKIFHPKREWRSSSHDKKIMSCA